MTSLSKPEQPNFEHPQKQSNQPDYDQVYTSVPDQTQLIQQVQDIQHKVDALIAQRVNLNTDIIGMFETLTAAPTGIPFNVFQQVKLATISGTTYLYLYDTAGHTWKRVALS